MQKWNVKAKVIYNVDSTVYIYSRYLKFDIQKSKLIWQYLSKL